VIAHFCFWKGDVFVSNQNLRDLLEQLHRELERTDTIDEEGNEMLRHLDADIRNLLKRSGADVEIDADGPLLERLQDTIDHFGATHPRLTTVLSEMMTILSNAGI
jgi:dsDNA-specific endonuclease/ATPase MutS2